ncbi:5-(carboxyamino)imidazole ribonucleotide synthase [Ferruginivarius sediminum]|uniref:N5-carboxyaminoimidazole ribonucleotide synthase n=1 Tax=Ferruginivarius sediminum TaxID=2661937 RepID=A0A369TC74_9PROT|nr:5-(carboxyamino)imidazole ribonucleotide synthase [Ferruginivarius sediminum]RDD61767.1 5-(carboxyamino)imidazole ribonucleotide synthase [Ferruginivarius sediminum]
MAASNAKTQAIPPSATIGILGGGQLGRMTALAAAPLGYRVHIFCPDAGSPATQVCDRHTIAPYDDAEALAAFAASVDVVTYEFENVPAATADALAGKVPLRPKPEILAICQDRLKEKNFLNGIGVPTAPFAEARDAEALDRALREIGRPAVLKSVRMGYDGKGQVGIAPDTDPAAAWAEMAGSIPDATGVVEGWVDFDLEISVIVARGVDGEMATYVPGENHHTNHILHRTYAPARVADPVAEHAESLARRIAERIDLVGVMGVEMFVTPEGDVLVNELAPRPHNSGHWTIDACVASQFEQHARSVAGLPLASTDRLANAVMQNLLGDEVNGWPGIVREPHAKLHLYGKAEVKPGRKMGHVTRLYPHGPW